MNKYINAYKEQFENEMLWDIVLRKRSGDEAWSVVKSLNKRYWMADPFLFDYEGKCYLFYERFDRKHSIGEIACRIIYPDCSTGKESVVLRRPYHLSFPNVFEYKDMIYMIPETSGNKTIEIYKAVEFPMKWKLIKEISNEIQAVDTIVTDFDEHSISLLTSIIGEDACNVSNYKILITDEFDLINKTLIKEASEYGNRNAGKIVSTADGKYRYGQDCRGGEYGTGLVKYRVDHNSEMEISYVAVEDIISNSKYSGVHTYNVSNMFETVDLRYIKRKNLLQKIQLLGRLIKNYVKRRIKN
jgi:hypothetical protein